MNRGRFAGAAILAAMAVCFAAGCQPPANAGGTDFLFNDGQFNEPALGVMIMSVKSADVSISFYVATPERVIQGTLTGRSQ